MYAAEARAGTAVEHDAFNNHINKQHPCQDQTAVCMPNISPGVGEPDCPGLRRLCRLYLDGRDDKT